MSIQLFIYLGYLNDLKSPCSSRYRNITDQHTHAL